MQSSFFAVEAALFFVLTSDGANDKQPPVRLPPSTKSSCSARAAEPARPSSGDQHPSPGQRRNALIGR